MPPGAAKLDTYKKPLTSFVKAIELTPTPLERVEIDSPDGILPGYIIPAGTGKPAPIIIFYSGFDVVKEMLYGFIREEFAQRGISCLVVDTPGVGEPLRLRNVPSRPDYEVPTAAIVDYLETRPDVDASRIGIMGISLGGYYDKRDYEAAQRYWSPDYIQHSAHIASGREGLFNLIKSMPPTLKYEPGVILADGDFVINRPA
jgi:hypothetical protein